MGIIKTCKLVYEYIRRDENNEIAEKLQAIKGVDIDIEEGQFVAILGRNGSGKSTLAKHMNALFFPTDGTVWVGDMDTKDESHILDIRQTAGMVFQNPDNQIVSTIVEEDVGFGPENMGVPSKEIWKRVDESLKAVGMTAYRKDSPNHLSGGQKQRIAIAGVMAMRPRCIVLDEPTAMLDPNGRKEVIRTIRELNQKEHITVILITHYMEETVHADRVIVMDDGEIRMDGTPREIFTQVEELKRIRLDVPQVTELAYELRRSCPDIPEGILTIAEFLQVMEKKAHQEADGEQSEEDLPVVQAPLSEAEILEAPLMLRHVGYTYGAGTPMEKKVLKDVNFSIRSGQFISIIGHTGSGKSTLIQHLNGLLPPSEGEVLFHGTDIQSEGFDKRALRGKVGLVFQYPEHQLFESDVFTDVCFGPRNQGLGEEEIKARARAALDLVGLDPSFDTRSPFELSGGQKRRVAIAGVLAMKPEVLVLDEPTAGLDPGGRDEILEQVARLHRESGLTVVLVSHSMEDVANYAERLIVMDDGHVAFDGTPKAVFRHHKELEKMGLSAPQVTYIAHALREKGWAISPDVTTVQEMRDAILTCLK